MRKHIVTGKSLAIHSGLVGLNKDQVRRRRHLIVDTDVDGVYSLKEPISFKNGEEFTHDGDLTRVQGVETIFTADELAEREAEKAAKRAVPGRDTANLAQPTLSVTIAGDKDPDAGTDDDAGIGDADNPYAALGREALKEECALRGLEHANAAGDNTLRELLLEDDATRPDIDTDTDTDTDQI